MWLGCLKASARGFLLQPYVTEFRFAGGAVGGFGYLCLPGP